MSEENRDIGYDIDKLPPMPLVATRMVELINSSRTSADEMANVISSDPVISARVLKIANSSFYSMARKVNTLSTAIVILGEKTLKNLVLAANLRGLNTKFGPTEQMLWEDSMTCALGARFLSRSLGVGDPEEAFVGGLFRHLGRVVLNNQNPGYKKLMAQETRCGVELMALEQAEYGINHAELGSAVLRHWQLSEVMSQIALHHHDNALAEIPDRETRDLTALVNVANEFPFLLGIFGAYGEDLYLEDLSGARYLHLDAERLEELVEDFRNVFEENREDFLS